MVSRVGVGRYGWIDGLQELANSRVTDAQMASAMHRFPHNTPLTKEAYMYASPSLSLPCVQDGCWLHQQLLIPVPRESTIHRYRAIFESHFPSASAAVRIIISTSVSLVTTG